MSAPVSVHLGIELWRNALRKGRWAKLSAPVQAYLRSMKQLEHGCNQDDDDAYVPIPWMQQVVASLDFHTTIDYPVGRTEHINCSEMRAHLAMERHESVTNPGSRVFGFADSQVQLGGTVKGRGQSGSLNELLCVGLCYAISGDVYVGSQYEPSKSNPAEDPTRGRPVRAASIRRPS